MYLLVYLFYVIVVAALLWVLVSVLGHQGLTRHWRLVLSQDWWRSVERLLVRLLGLLRDKSEI